MPASAQQLPEPGDSALRNGSPLTLIAVRHFPYPHEVPHPLPLSQVPRKARLTATLARAVHRARATNTSADVRLLPSGTLVVDVRPNHPASELDVRAHEDEEPEAMALRQSAREALPAEYALSTRAEAVVRVGTWLVALLTNKQGWPIRPIDPVALLLVPEAGEPEQRRRLSRVVGFDYVFADNAAQFHPPSVQRLTVRLAGVSPTCAAVYTTHATHPTLLVPRLVVFADPDDSEARPRVRRTAAARAGLKDEDRPLSATLPWAVPPADATHGGVLLARIGAAVH